jgi:hypothetical protein
MPHFKPGAELRYRVDRAVKEKKPGAEVKARKQAKMETVA